MTSSTTKTCGLLFQIGIIPIVLVSIIIVVFTIDDSLPKYPNRREKLLLLQVMFSNGEQEAPPLLPHSPRDGDVYWLNESSLLALAGQKRAYKLGRTLKNFYQLYLQNNDFTPDLVHSSTGYLDILQATLQCVHAGLFPTFPGAQIININVDWRPVPYRVYAKKEDVLIYQKDLLESIRALRLDSPDSTNSDEGLLKMHQTLEKVSTLLQYNVSLSDVVMIQDHLNAKAWRHELLGEWTDIYPDNTQRLVHEFWRLFGEKEKYSAVPLLNEVLENIKNKMAGKLPNARKLHLFSGHRLNLAAILSALRSWNSTMGTIAPCSYILLEFVQEIQTDFYKIYTKLKTFLFCCVLVKTA